MRSTAIAITLATALMSSFSARAEDPPPVYCPIESAIELPVLATLSGLLDDIVLILTEVPPACTGLIIPIGPPAPPPLPLPHCGHNCVQN
jgi:hypothetical protein